MSQNNIKTAGNIHVKDKKKIYTGRHLMLNCST